MSDGTARSQLSSYYKTCLCEIYMFHLQPPPRLLAVNPGATRSLYIITKRQGITQSSVILKLMECASSL
jgi:hypothetical protein